MAERCRHCSRVALDFNIVAIRRNCVDDSPTSQELGPHGLDCTCDSSARRCGMVCLPARAFSASLTCVPDSSARRNLRVQWRLFRPTRSFARWNSDRFLSPCGKGTDFSLCSSPGQRCPDKIRWYRERRLPLLVGGWEIPRFLLEWQTP